MYKHRHVMIRKTSLEILISVLYACKNVDNYMDTCCIKQCIKASIYTNPIDDTQYAMLDMVHLFEI